MKKSFRHLLQGSAAAILTTGAVQAAPFLSIADTVDIFFLGKASAEYRTNLFNAYTTKHDDFVFTLSPGVEARIGRDSNATVSLIFREDFVVYHRFHSQNASLANVLLDGTYNSGPLNLSGGFSFRQTQSNTPDTFVPGTPSDTFVKRDLYNIYTNVKYDISPKFWSKGSFTWHRADYTNSSSFGNSFSNSDVYALPLDVFYRYSEKLSVGLGYRYRYTETSSNATHGKSHYNDHFFSLAINGELAPKLNASANIGYQFRDANQHDSGQFALDARLDYNLTAKVNLFAGGGHDFGVSSTGGGKEVLAGYVGGDYQINSFVSATARFDQIHTKYSGSSAGRKDDTSNVYVGVNYAPNVYWTFSAGYGYSNNSSNVTLASYMSNTFSLSASLRY